MKVILLTSNICLLTAMTTTDNLAIVLGMFETGLGVGRALGRAEIPVLGLDYSKKIGFYSRYIKSAICPHPLEHEEAFVVFLLEIAAKQKYKPVLFITADEFINSREYVIGRAI